jgi:hypothetical protein
LQGTVTPKKKWAHRPFSPPTQLCKDFHASGGSMSEPLIAILAQASKP